VGQFLELRRALPRGVFGLRWFCRRPIVRFHKFQINDIPMPVAANGPRGDRRGLNLVRERIDFGFVALNQPPVHPGFHGPRIRRFAMKICHQQPAARAQHVEQARGQPASDRRG